MTQGKLFRIGDLVARRAETRAGPALGIVVDSSLSPYDYRVFSVKSGNSEHTPITKLWEGYEIWDCVELRTR